MGCVTCNTFARYGILIIILFKLIDYRFAAKAGTAGKAYSKMTMRRFFGQRGIVAGVQSIPVPPSLPKMRKPEINVNSIEILFDFAVKMV